MHCPICESPDQEILERRSNQICSSFWKQECEPPRLNISIAICPSCSFVYYPEAYLDPAYSVTMSEVYKGYTLMESGKKPFPIDSDAVLYALSFVLPHLQSFSNPYVIEAGSSRGDFLFHLKTNYPSSNVLGIEPSQLSFYGVPTVNSELRDGLICGQFDLAVSRHVLEHIAGPRQFLTRLKLLLKEDGRLFIEVPNIKNDLFSLKEPFIAEHVNHFCVESIETLLSTIGMEIVDAIDRSDAPLCVIARSNSEVQTKFTRSADIRQGLSIFLGASRAMIDRISEMILKESKVIFFGAGNIFLSTYGVLEQGLGASRISASTIAVLDDSPERIGRSFYGHSVKPFSVSTDLDCENTIYIVCTMNDTDREKMITRVRSLGVADQMILYPWQ